MEHGEERNEGFSEINREAKTEGVSKLFSLWYS